MINVRDIGAIGNGKADDTTAFQTAIDNAVNANDTVFIPKGRYRITQSLNAFRDFKNFSIRIVGEGNFWDVELSHIIYDSKQGHCLNIQNGKGCVIEGISFEGKYTSPKADIYRTEFKDWNDPTITEDRYNPHCAIAVDAIKGPTRSGSTGTVIRNCSFRNFTGAINYSPNGFTLNNELNTVENCRGRNLKYFLSGNQAQEKLNRIINIGLWDNIHTCFIWGLYGGGQPGHYVIDGLNTAGKIGNLFFRPSQSFFPLHVTNVFSEMLGSIGFWNTTMSDTLSNSIINLVYPQTGAYNIVLSGNGLKIKDSTIRYYGMNIPVLFKGNIELDRVMSGTNPIIGHRYAPTDPHYMNGFELIGNNKWQDYTIENNTTNIEGEYQIGDVIVFYAGNYDYMALGQVTNVTKGIATVSYLNAKSGKYRIGKYKSK